MNAQLAGRAGGLDRLGLQAGLRFERAVMRHADIAQRPHPRLRACGRGRVGCGPPARSRPRGGLGGRSVVGHGPRAAASARAGARVWVAAPPPEARTGTGAGASATSAGIGAAVRSAVGTRRARRLRQCAPPTSSSARAITATATNTAIPTGSVLSVGVPRRCGVVARIGGRCARGRCVCRRAVGVWSVRRGGAAAGLSWRASRRVVWGPAMPSTASPRRVLEASHRGLGPRAKAPVDRARTDAHRAQLALQRADPTRPASPVGARTSRQRHRRVQGGTGAGADDPVDHQPTGRLEPAHRGLGQRAEAPIDRAGVDAHRAQTALQGAHRGRPLRPVKPRAADQQRARATAVGGHRRRGHAHDHERRHRDRHQHHVPNQRCVSLPRS